jgi:hypothetical protein
MLGYTPRVLLQRRVGQLVIAWSLFAFGATAQSADPNGLPGAEASAASSATAAPIAGTAIPSSPEAAAGAAEPGNTNTAHTLAPSAAPEFPDCQVIAEPALPDLVQLIENQLGPAPITSIGPIGDGLLEVLLDRLCVGTNLTAWLPNTCGAAGTFDVAQLRSRLLLDLTRAPAEYIRVGIAAASASERAALALLASVGGSIDPARVAQRAVAQLGYTAADALDTCVVPTATAGDSLGVGMLLFWRLSQDPTGTVLRTQAELEAVIARTLIEKQIAVQGVITPAQQQLVTRLAQSTLRLREQWRALRPLLADTQALSSAALWELMQAELGLLEAALSLSHSEPLVLPSEAALVLQALAQARVDALTELLSDWLVARAKLPKEVIERVEIALRFLAAENQAQAERILRELLLPWSKDWIVGGSAGVPQLKSGNFNVIAEGTLGYNAEDWGLIGRGGVSVFDIEEPSYLNTTLRAGGNADAWLAFEIAENTDIELRATFDATVFDTESTFLSASQNLLAYVEEESLLVRAGGLAGMRTQGPRWAVGLWAGGGFQLESYGNLAHDGSSQETQKDDTDSVGGAAEARVRLQWHLLQHVLALRAALDWKFYTLTRVAEAIAVGGGNANLVQLDSKALQMETIGRLFIDVEALRLLDFVPGVGIGADHYQLAVTGQDTAVTTVPVYLVGVRRTVF